MTIDPLYVVVSVGSPLMVLSIQWGVSQIRKTISEKQRETQKTLESNKVEMITAIGAVKTDVKDLRTNVTARLDRHDQMLAETNERFAWFEGQAGQALGTSKRGPEPNG